jgi:predicted peroxiredoxin
MPIFRKGKFLRNSHFVHIFSVKLFLSKAKKKVECMAKKQISELVNKLKKAGIKASLTKPKSNYLLSLQHIKKCPSSVN